jgi:hypothetical protein
MTIEDFRPCVCGHLRVSHGAGFCGGCQNVIGDDCCDGFRQAVEPYIEIAPSPNARLMVFDIGIWADEGFGERVSVDGITRLRLRPSDIAFADWKRKQAKP